MSLQDIHFDHLHHAYLIEGDRENVLPALFQLFHLAKIATDGNPDFLFREYGAFRIEDAHELRRAQSFTATEGARKIFVLAFHTMTGEAQNALLKTLEEPTKETYFFLVTRTRSLLTETVCSRLFMISSSSEDHDTSSAGEEFLALTVPERMKRVERITKVKATEKENAKEEARVLCDAIERALARSEDPGSATIMRARADVLTAKRYLLDRAPSLKILLEHLALTLPVLPRLRAPLP